MFAVTLDKEKNMAKIKISYENEVEKMKIIGALSKGVKINKISKSSKVGKYYKVYVDIE